MGNQIGIRLHCGPGDEFLCDQDAHVYQYEQATFAQLFGLSVATIATDDGLLTPDLVEPRLRPDNDHAPRTRLLTLENTFNRKGGRVLPLDDIARACRWAHGQGLATHLDGARLWNASVATGVEPARWVEHFDTVSVCFSKGLGAPVGSALCGSVEQVRRARRLRKAMGGGMRQAGILAAGALYALDHQFDRLAEDHAHARMLADAVRRAPHLRLLADRCDTNIVTFDLTPEDGSATDFCAAMAAQGVLMGVAGKQRIRAVTHLGVSRDEIVQVTELLAGEPHLAGEA